MKKINERVGYRMMKSIIGLLILISISSSGCGSSQAADPKKDGAMGGFAVKVVVVDVKRQLVEDRIPVSGSLAANEVVDIKSEIDGNVKDITFDEGQRVEEGQELIILDGEKLKANLNQVKATLSIAQATFERMKTLVTSGAVSHQEFDQAKSKLDETNAQVQLLQAQFNDTVIKAPFSGIIGERKISPGQVIARNATLTMIIDDDPMKAEFHVSERYLNRLAVGQKVVLQVAAFSKQEFTGDVYFISPQVNDVTRTALVKAKIPNPEGLLRQGMFAKVQLVIGQRPDALVIPESALMSNNEQVSVFIVDQENKAQMRSVKTGIRQNGEVEITEGLTGEDKVITEGFQKIGPGSLVDPLSPDVIEPTQT